MPMKSRGFSTIELVIIMILLGILAVVAATQLGKYYGGIKHENATMKIASDIRYAQNRATTTQQRSRVSFTSATAYEVWYCTAYDSAAGVCNCTGTWEYARDPSKGGDFQVDLSSDFSGVTIATIVGHCTEFDSLGRPYYNANCSTATSCNSSTLSTVTVQYSGEAPKTITVATQTGMVSY